ncbi:MAG: cytochrome d ubiquinol oxidase subunit II [Acidobacteriota bacterium]
MEPTWLQLIWYLLFVVLIIGYAVLDGFDLGVGVLSLLNRRAEERRLHINAVAPVWDGNEVWLLTGGGALFAAFPAVYATVFSGFYLALMLVLLGLIARAVSLEFRSKVDSPGWQAFWDRVFGIGSLLPALLFGVAVGNLLRGIPLTQTGEFAGTFLGLLNPFSLLVGLLSLVMFVTHGALFMAGKSSGTLRDRLLVTASQTWAVWVLLLVAANLYGFFQSPHLFVDAYANPWLWLMFFVLLGVLLYLPVPIRSKRPGRALMASSAGIIVTIAQAATALYPRLVPARNAEHLSLTIMNSSSSERTLTTMLVIALIGMPLVIAYTIFIYRVFKGRLVLDEYSY